MHAARGGLLKQPRNNTSVWVKILWISHRLKILCDTFFREKGPEVKSMYKYMVTVSPLRMMCTTFYEIQKSRTHRF